MEDVDITLRASYRACEQISKQCARNFYYAFAVLPKAKRQAICAIYAFMRYCDDISDGDNPEFSKFDALQAWRSALTDAMVGSYEQSEILPAFHDTIRTFKVPEEYFHELIDGAQMDLSVNRYRTFDDLYRYCYRVASVVGLVCIQVFGFKEDAARVYAEYEGIAFQLTNILRDVKEDADRNRIYLPQEDLDRFGYTEQDLLANVYDERFRELMKFEVARAREYYEKARPLVDTVDIASRAGLVAMVGIYSTLLDRIEERRYDVFRERVTLSSREKLGIAARSLIWSRPNGREPELAAK